ncbi:MAG: aldehyde dehydrogenase family protein, partial [Paraglaciecola sp.]|nr:aldehyde dehydrogenase family protein [Paraglaciecola sp.]
MQNIDKLFINGRWVKSQSTESIALVNPSNETVIGNVIAANEDDVNIAVAAARKAFPKWSAVSSTQRSAIIKNIAKGMEKRKAELAQAISTTMGCPEHIASWLQVEDSIYAMALFSEQPDITEKEVQGNKCIIVKESIGVCAFINPWNFPLHQFVGKVGAALAAGCTMVVKPAEQTPLQDYIMAEILADCDLPDGVFNLVFGTGQVVGNALTSHPDVDMVSFTGSTQAGIKVAQSAAATVKRVTQELGGKSPLIITEEA